VRAIEVSLLAGKPFSSLRADWSGEPGAPAVIWGVALERDRQDLYGRIDARVRRMFDQGVVEEVRKAEAGPTAAAAIGYAEIKSLLRGEMNTEECVTAIQQRTRRYAKRQLTWLRSENTISAINLTHTPLNKAVEEIERRILAGRPDAETGAGGATSKDV
jgi:tRNA dimethylallyltransferase